MLEQRKVHGMMDGAGQAGRTQAKSSSSGGRPKWWVAPATVGQPGDRWRSRSLRPKPRETRPGSEAISKREPDILTGPNGCCFVLQPPTDLHQPPSQNVALVWPITPRSPRKSGSGSGNTRAVSLGIRLRGRWNRKSGNEPPNVPLSSACDKSGTQFLSAA